MVLEPAIRPDVVVQLDEGSRLLGAVVHNAAALRVTGFTLRYVDQEGGVAPDGSWAAGTLAAHQVVQAHGTSARVIVVGAGLAGVAATAALDTAGVDVTAFEATDRLGGQALTARVGGASVDLGRGR